jgi:DHA1 family tetracycline resistance protein-like MFS transporter
MIGISLTVVGLLVALVQAGLTRIVTPRLGNERTIYTGFFMYSLGLFLFAFATQGWMMFAFLVPYCLGGIAGPALQSVLAGHIPPNEQGELQGTLTSLMSLTAVIGPPIMNNLFYYFTKSNAPVHFPGVSFLLASVFMLLSTWIAWHVFKREKKMGTSKGAEAADRAIS